MSNLRLRKIFSCGEVLAPDLYRRLQVLDSNMFYGCEGEFRKNRDWWVIVDNDIIVAYCGSWYSEGVCMMNRAWVYKPYRGKGLQRRMIATRVKAADQKDCTVVITYTTVDNPISSNNLIRMGFNIYDPCYKYAGKGMNYFKRST